MTISPVIFIGVILLTAVVTAALTAFWLRRRFGGAAPSRPHLYTPEQAQPPVHSRQTFLHPDFRPVKLSFGTSAGDSPVIEISALQADALPSTKHPFDPSSTKLSTFSPFLKLIPLTLTGAEFGGGNYIQIEVHGPRALASKPESFLPLIRGAGGQVEKLAELENSEQLQQAIRHGVMWQLAFLIVARRHLADIDAKLDYIKSGINEIQKFLKNERRSKIAGTFDYLRQVVKTLGNRDSSAALRNQVEHIERELLQCQTHIMRDLGGSAEKIDMIIQGRFKRRTTLAKNINDRADEMYELEKEWLLCILARTLNWQVLCVFPGDKQFKITRRAAIYKSIDEFTLFVRHVYGQLNEKIALVRSVLDSLSMKEQEKSGLVQMDIKRRIIVDSGQICSDVGAIRNEVGEFANRLWSPQKPIMLALRLDKGRIAEAYDME